MAVILPQSLGTLALGFLLYRSRLVPRWLSGWAMLAALATLLASLLVLAGTLQVASSVYLGLNAPMALQELVFAFWLLVRGLRRPSP